MATLYSLGEVGHRLAVPTYRILYLLNSRQIDEPQRVAGRRVWTLAQIEGIAERMKGRAAKEVGNGT
jgi:hypothetical protein